MSRKLTAMVGQLFHFCAVSLTSCLCLVFRFCYNIWPPNTNWMLPYQRPFPATLTFLPTFTESIANSACLRIFLALKDFGSPMIWCKTWAALRSILRRFMASRFGLSQMHNCKIILGLVYASFFYCPVHLRIVHSDMKQPVVTMVLVLWNINL